MSASPRGRTPDDKPGDRDVAMPFTGRAVAYALTLLSACAASAATRTSAFQVSAAVAASCRVVAPSFVPSHRVVASSVARIHCTSPTPYAIALQSTPRDRDAPSTRALVVLITY